MRDTEERGQPMKNSAVAPCVSLRAARHALPAAGIPVVRWVLPALVALSICPAGARAESLLEGWDHGQVTVYGWLPGMEGEQDGPDGSPIVSLDASDILEMLNFAFMGSGEIRRGRVGLAFDIQYTDLGTDGTLEGTIIPGADPASASVDTSLLMATGAVTYRFYDQGGRWADVYGGLRAYDVDLDFSWRIPTRDVDEHRSTSTNWVDAIVGLRGHATFGDRFGVTGLADVGGFGIGSGADLTWQVQGTLDYAFTERIIGRLGYRYMSIDYSDSDLAMDVNIYGPLIGLTWTF